MRFSIISQDFESAQIREPFSVCMTVKNEGHSIGAFLESLMAQTAAADEIVIVDGGSRDDTINILAKYLGKLPLNVLTEDGASPAQGRNIASSKARNEIQVMVDAGTLLHKNLFANLVGPFAEDVDLVAGIYGPMVQSRWANYFVPNWDNERTLREKFLPSCRSTAIRRSLIRKVGGFPTNLKQRWGEDTAFGMQAKEVSRYWILNRNAYVLWDAPKTLEEAKHLAYRYGMGNGETNCTYYEQGYLRSTDPVLIAALEGYRHGCQLRRNP